MHCMCFLCSSVVLDPFSNHEMYDITQYIRMGQSITVFFAGLPVPKAESVGKSRKQIGYMESPWAPDQVSRRDCCDYRRVACLLARRQRSTVEEPVALAIFSRHTTLLHVSQRSTYCKPESTNYRLIFHQLSFYHSTRHQSPTHPRCPRADVPRPLRSALDPTTLPPRRSSSGATSSQTTRRSRSTPPPPAAALANRRRPHLRRGEGPPLPVPRRLRPATWGDDMGIVCRQPTAAARRVRSAERGGRRGRVIG